MKRLLIFLAALILIYSSGIYEVNAQIMGEGMMGRGAMGGKETGERAWLGVFIQNITPEITESLGLNDVDGVIVSDVSKGGPADAAGIKREDVIKGINGKEVKIVDDLLSIIRETSPEDIVAVDISRRGKMASVKVKLGRLKESMGEEMMAPEMGGQGMMEQGMTSPQYMGEMMGQMMGQMMQGMMRGMMQGMRGGIEGMMHGMGGMMGRMGEDLREGSAGCPDFHGGMKGDYGRYGMGYHKETFLTRTLIDRLQLTSEQIDKMGGIDKIYRKESIRLYSEIKIAEIDLDDLLKKDDEQMSEIEKKVKEIEAKKTELHLNRIKAFNWLKGIITKEQKDRLKNMGCF